MDKLDQVVAGIRRDRDPPAVINCQFAIHRVQARIASIRTVDDDEPSANLIVAFVHGGLLHSPAKSRTGCRGLDFRQLDLAWIPLFFLNAETVYRFSAYLDAQPDTLSGKPRKTIVAAEPDLFRKPIRGHG